MSTRKPIAIPVVSAPQADAPAAACDDKEIVALQVLGDSMLPEFSEGEILVIEMGAAAWDGAFVIAEANGEPIFRQLQRAGERWALHALNPAYPEIDLPGLEAVRGVVTQKRTARSRKSAKFYPPPVTA